MINKSKSNLNSISNSNFQPNNKNNIVKSKNFVEEPDYNINSFGKELELNDDSFESDNQSQSDISIDVKLYNAPIIEEGEIDLKKY
jgi:hypothetical protein